MNFNPYAQGGWANPQNQDCISNVPWSLSSPPQPSVYGALPFAGEPQYAQDTMHRFGFKYEQTILKSIVFGPHNKPCFRVAHDLPKPGMTTFTDTEGRDFALIDWHDGAPQVEMKGLLEKQAVSSWMPLSSDQSQRAMFARGKGCSWIPNQNSICLFASTHGSMTPCVYAKIYRDSKLKLSSSRSPRRHPDRPSGSCVVAAVLLQSGNNID
ncbi:hypothetical protein BDZ89DRAFT_990021 [Hymenopellis radicata]|nr:hypothetical protein BDZ89DRAFT_990021 [Hymenopellis radicata]